MKIDREKMEEITNAIYARNNLRQQIRDTYSNKALAKSIGVNVRTIEKIARICQPTKESA